MIRLSLNFDIWQPRRAEFRSRLGVSCHRSAFLATDLKAIPRSADVFDLRHLWKHLLVKLIQTCQKFCHFWIVGISLQMIKARRLNDQIHDIWETTATTAFLVHRMVQFPRNNQLPAIFIEHIADCVAYVHFGDKIAAANKHMN